MKKTLTVLYNQLIILHRAKPGGKIICRSRKNILTEGVIEEEIKNETLHLNPIKSKGMVTEGVIKEGLMKD